ncbi:hypothetical protein ENBRE01_0277 [Enteropsectra breve]|nr:hypothetical protein ENBRE01_0277 [Enteropsectra breve]
MAEISLQSIEQFASMALHLVGLQITKKPFMMRPDVLFWIRVTFAVTSVIQAALSLFIYYRINKKNDKTVIKVAQSGILSGADADEVEMTVREYDLSQCKSLLSSSVLYPIGVAFVHYKWNVIHPFVLQITSLIKNLLFNSLFHAYLFNKTILRPYNRNMLFQTTEKPEVEEITDDEPVQKIDKKRKKED